MYFNIALISSAILASSAVVFATPFNNNNIVARGDDYKSNVSNCFIVVSVITDLRVLNQDVNGKYDDKKDVKYDNGKYYNGTYDNGQYYNGKYDDGKNDNGKYDNKKDHSYDNKKDHSYDNKKDHSYDNKKDHSYDNKKDHSYDNKKSSNYNNKGDNKYSDDKGKSDYQKGLDQHQKDVEAQIKNTKEYEKAVQGASNNVSNSNKSFVNLTNKTNYNIE